MNRIPCAVVIAIPLIGSPCMTEAELYVITLRILKGGNFYEHCWLCVTASEMEGTVLDLLWLFIDLAFWEAMGSQNGHSYLPVSSENATAGLLSRSGNISQLNAEEPKALWNEVRYYILSENHADKEKFCRESLKNLGLLISKGWYSSQSRQSIVVVFICFSSKMLLF